MHQHPGDPASASESTSPNTPCSHTHTASSSGWPRCVARADEQPPRHGTIAAVDRGDHCNPPKAGRRLSRSSRKTLPDRIQAKYIMTRNSVPAPRAARVSCTLLLGSLLCSAAQGQDPNAPPANLAKQAIDNRKAIFTLIGSNFRPIGEILRGTPYELVDVNKFASRVAFLSGLLPEAFADNSRTGDTRAAPEVWSNRADFNKRLKNFGDHAVALSQLVQGGGDLDAFKSAARTVAQDCKGCHDTYRTK